MGEVALINWVVPEVDLFNEFYVYWKQLPKQFFGSLQFMKIKHPPFLHVLHSQPFRSTFAAKTNAAPKHITDKFPFHGLWFATAVILLKCIKPNAFEFSLCLLVRCFFTFGLFVYSHNSGPDPDGLSGCRHLELTPQLPSQCSLFARPAPNSCPIRLWRRRSGIKIVTLVYTKKSVQKELTYGLLCSIQRIWNMQHDITNCKFSINVKLRLVS